MTDFVYDGWPTTGAVRSVIISSRSKIVGEDQAAAEFDGWLAAHDEQVCADERRQRDHEFAGIIGDGVALSRGLVTPDELRKKHRARRNDDE